jgi:hypothetical protein
MDDAEGSINIDNGKYVPRELAFFEDVRGATDQRASRGDTVVTRPAREQSLD